MSDDHWVTRRMTCTSDVVFDAVHAEVEKAVNCWNEIDGSNPPVLRVARGKDSDGFEKIWISDSTNWRAYFGHIPSNGTITATNTSRVNGQLKSNPVRQCRVRWNASSDGCVIAGSDGEEFTVESLVRAVLEPVLFPD